MRLQCACLGGLQEDVWERTNPSRIWWFWFWALVSQTCCSNWRNLWLTICRRKSRIHFSVFQKSQDDNQATLEHFWVTSNLFYEAVHDIFRKIYGRRSGDPIREFGRECGHVGVFMNATFDAAVHLRNDHDAKLRNAKDSFLVFQGTCSLMSRSMSIPTRCCVRENRKQSCWVVGETNWVVVRNQLLLRIESNWWKTHGVPEGDFPRTHDSIERLD